jgi:hypothetical protein
MTGSDPTQPLRPTTRSPWYGLTSPRALAARALVAYVALFLFFAFILWLAPGDVRFTVRSLNAGFTDLFIMAMPVVAVVLAVHIKPSIPGARLITVIALIEYAVALLFGVITFLIGLGAVLDRIDDANDAVGAFRHVVLGLAELALIGVAAYIVVTAFTSLGGRLPVGRGPQSGPPSA